ncbi:MAG: hypothetical protein ACLGGX_06860 [Bdellovibrionia bacterium]
MALVFTALPGLEMTMNPLPPQAYTKDTMLKAYAWLMNQNASIREMATTPDILVSLYLKANRDGDAALDRPSIQNFKNELKSLAGMMGELDKIPSPKFIEKASEQTSPAPMKQVHSGSSTSSHTAARPPVTETQDSSPTPAMTTAAVAASHSTNQNLGLDAESLKMIQETRLQFNLSSDQEAMRMLIKIGFTKAQNLLK